MTTTDLVQNGYTDITTDNLKAIWLCDKVYQKIIKPPKDYSRVVTYGKMLYSILVKVYHASTLNGHQLPTEYVFSARFYESWDGQLFWDCELSGIGDKTDISVLKIEERIKEFYEKLNFIPDPNN